MKMEISKENLEILNKIKKNIEEISKTTRYDFNNKEHFDIPIKMTNPNRVVIDIKIDVKD